MEKTIYFVLVFFGCLFIMTGCRKDEMAGGIQLTAEDFMHGNAKTIVSGNEVHWVDGDKVRINGQTGTVNISGGTACAVGIESLSGDIRGYYPASIITASGAANENTDNPTVVFPQRFSSSFSGGSQVIALPMVGRANEGATILQFKHISAAINVRVKNSTGRSRLYVDSIVVVSADKQLCGAASVTLSSSGEPSVSGSSNVAANRSVVVYFDEPMLISGDYLQVQVPILPVASGELTFNVYTHALLSEIYPGVTKAHYSYNYSRALTNGTLGRNVLGTVQIAVTGASSYVTEVDRGYFTINTTGGKVRFSQGNLQYQAVPGTWRFATNQYDYIGNAAGNTTKAAGRPTQSAWIDYFGWGTSGYNNKYPYMISGTATDYGDGSNPITGTEYDWGIHNAISNGGNATGLWRTLAKEEWQKLLNRTTSISTVGGYATVAGKTGFILIPDYFVDPMVNNGSGSFVGFSATGFSRNVYSADAWEKMEAMGAVFLPASGFNNVGLAGEPSISEVGTQGDYWSTTNYSTEYSYEFRLTDANVRISGNTDRRRRIGCSVRLVRNY